MLIFAAAYFTDIDTLQATPARRQLFSSFLSIYFLRFSSSLIQPYGHYYFRDTDAFFAFYVFAFH